MGDKNQVSPLASPVNRAQPLSLECVSTQQPSLFSALKFGSNPKAGKEKGFIDNPITLVSSYGTPTVYESVYAKHVGRDI